MTINRNSMAIPGIGEPVHKGAATRNAYVVGEAGPELFVPDRRGKIVPNPATRLKLAGRREYGGVVTPDDNKLPNVPPRKTPTGYEGSLLLDPGARRTVKSAVEGMVNYNGIGQPASSFKLDQLAPIAPAVDTTAKATSMLSSHTPGASVAQVNTPSVPSGDDSNYYNQGRGGSAADAIAKDATAVTAPTGRTVQVALPPIPPIDKPTKGSGYATVDGKTIAYQDIGVKGKDPLLETYDPSQNQAANAPSYQGAPNVPPIAAPTAAADSGDTTATPPVTTPGPISLAMQGIGTPAASAPIMEQSQDAFGKGRVDDSGKPIMFQRASAGIPMGNAGWGGVDAKEAVKQKLGFVPSDYDQNPIKYQDRAIGIAADLTGQGHLLTAQSNAAIVPSHIGVNDATALKLRAESVMLPQKQKAEVNELISRGNYYDADAVLKKAEAHEKTWRTSDVGVAALTAEKGHNDALELLKEKGKTYTAWLHDHPGDVSGAAEAAAGIENMSRGMVPVTGTPAVEAKPGHLFGLFGGTPGKPATPTTWVNPGSAPPTGFNPTGKTSGGKPVYTDGKQYWTP